MDPSGIWLRETYGNRAFFPTNEGTFDLSSEGVQPFSNLTVEGEGSGSGNRTTTPSVTLSATAGGSSSRKIGTRITTRVTSFRDYF